MRKQELVHLHALCSLVREQVEARSDAPPGAFERYDDLDVSPAEIYLDKQCHRRAVLLLASEIASAIDEEPTPMTEHGR